MTNTHVIVGAGLAGAKAAETLRQEGFDGEVVLIGDEPVAPYERPPLSKGYLRGEKTAADTQVHEDGYYDTHGIDLRTDTSAEAIDTATREVALSGGERLRYDRLLLATGAEPRILAVPGADLDGVHYLRERGDSDRLRQRFREGGRLAVIGGGWIGSEVAASARTMGLEVTILEQGGLPLEHVLGHAVGRVYADVHADHGTQVLTEVQVERIEGARRVERLRLADGRTLDADIVVVGIGVTPRTQLAERAGIAVENGVLVSDGLATDADGVFAAGDVANAEHPFYRRRVRTEHWANALNQSQAAARAMLGHEVVYDRLPYFFSDQYDVGMEYSGRGTKWDSVVFRGDPAAREFIAFWLRSERVVAGMNVNVWDVTAPIQDLIRSRRVVSPASLRDPGVPLEDLVAAAVQPG